MFPASPFCKIISVPEGVAAIHMYNLTLKVETTQNSTTLIYWLVLAQSTHSSWATCCLQTFEIRKHLELFLWQSQDRMPKQYWKLM